MQVEQRKKIRVALLDLYEGYANEGMRCIRELLNQFGEIHHLDLDWDEFDVRRKMDLPGLEYDIYISSGGPGSPLDSEGTEWENRFFQWIKMMENHNSNPENEVKKNVLFICHSFQLACRYFKIATVSKRKSTSFGVFPIHLLDDAKEELVFEGLQDPFYAVDSRDYQVVQPDEQAIYDKGVKILAIEKDRPHVALERAIMAIRFNEYMIGTQFHPEADAVGMTMYLLREDKKQNVINEHGEEKWHSMIDHLNDPDKILWTQSHVIPNFLTDALDQLAAVKPVRF